MDTYVGDQFDIDVVFTDLGANQAVFSGYADLGFDPAVLQADTITHDADYAFGRTGAIDNVSGVVDELGATAGITPPADGRVATVRFTVLAAGTTTVSSNIGEEALSEIIVYGDVTDKRNDTDFGSLEIQLGFLSVDLAMGSGDTVVDLQGGDLVVTQGMNELFRMAEGNVAQLTMNGTSDAEMITVGAVNTPLIIDAMGGDDQIDGSASLSTLTVLAGDGNDVVTTTNQNDVVIGGGGDDVISGLGGDDVLLGSAGSDRMNGGAGNDQLRGNGASNDILTGGPGDDVLNGDAGSDTIFEEADVNFTATSTSLTGNGNDTISNVEAITLIGGVSDNTIDVSGFNGPAILLGLEGNDVITGGPFNDFLLGASGKDVLNGGAGDDVLRGQGFSNDILTGGLGNDVLDGGPGNDALFEEGDADYVLTDGSMTGLGNDQIIATERATILGGVGNNNIDASAFTGDVVILGLGGDDILRGGLGNDFLLGASGKDQLFGGAGNDVLKGQGGSGDVMSGGAGNDDLDGGGGNDSLFEEADTDFTLTDNANSGDGNDTIASVESATLLGGAGNNTIDASGFSGGVVILGLGGDDVLTGGPGNDFLLGASGKDQMNGGAGNDVLKGQGGSGDVLTGGLGDDNLDGGAGNDALFEAGDADITATDNSLTGLGNDVLTSIESATILGGNSNNVLDGTNFSGPLNILGLGGDDILRGGPNNDQLRGSAGKDIIQGNGGDDQLFGQGASGDDLDGGPGADLVDGGGGCDTLRIDALDNVISEACDTLIGP